MQHVIQEIKRLHCGTQECILLEELRNDTKLWDNMSSCETCKYHKVMEYCRSLCEAKKVTKIKGNKYAGGDLYFCPACQTVLKRKDSETECPECKQALEWE